LSPPLTADLNARVLGQRTLEFLGTDGRCLATPILPSNPDLAYGMSTLQLLSHAGSHLDAPARLLRGGAHPGQIPLDRLFGRAKIIDLRWHDRHSPLQITDLELADISVGDIVLLFVDYEPPTSDQWPSYAPLSAQASEWLVAKRIRALGTDMPTIGSYEKTASRLQAGQPPESVWAEYVPFFQAQIPVISGLVNLGAVADEPNVVFVAFPLPLTQSTGSPVRAVALVY
jgi:kynurenine formamidase